jgi:hypothetical protein
MRTVLLTQLGVVNQFVPYQETLMRVSGLLSTSFVLIGLATASVSLAASEIISEQAPPALKVEIAPAARDGYVWSPGHWEWSGHSYYWVSGNWVVQRRGARYVENQWQQVGGAWHFVKGHWER